MDKVTIKVKGGTVTDVQTTSSEIEVEIIDEDGFDLPAHLLGNIYPQMDEDEKANWSLEEAEALAQDLLLDGIDADAEEIYETIAEFIAQDADELCN